MMEELVDVQQTCFGCMFGNEEKQEAPEDWNQMPPAQPANVNETGDLFWPLAVSPATLPTEYKVS